MQIIHPATKMQGWQVVLAAHTFKSSKNIIPIHKFSNSATTHLCSQHFLCSLATLISKTTAKMKKQKTKEKAFDVPVRILSGMTTNKGKQRVSSYFTFLTNFTTLGSSYFISVESMAAWSNFSALWSQLATCFYYPSLYLDCPSPYSTLESISFLIRLMTVTMKKRSTRRKVMNMIPLWQF